MSVATSNRRLQRANAAIRQQTLRVNAAIKQQRLRVIPLNDRGAIRISGPGVDLVAAGLQHVDPSDLIPHSIDEHTGDSKS